ncbi:hypothetical protein GCM10010433_20510 [Streptomyces pulveraceus]
MTQPPDGDHESCTGLIMKQVIRLARTDMDFSGNKGLKPASGSRSRHRSPSTWRPRTSSDPAPIGRPRRTGSMVGTADEPGGRPRGDPRISPRNVRAPQGRVMANGHPG